LCGIIAQWPESKRTAGRRVSCCEYPVTLTIRKGEFMKQIASLVMVLCLGLFVVAGCNKPEPVVKPVPKPVPVKTEAKPAAKEDMKAPEKKADDKKMDEKKADEKK
jgi:hypothetical protein